MSSCCNKKIRGLGFWKKTVLFEPKQNEFFIYNLSMKYYCCWQNSRLLLWLTCSNLEFFWKWSCNSCMTKWILVNFPKGPAVWYGGLLVFSGCAHVKQLITQMSGVVWVMLVSNRLKACCDVWCSCGPTLLHCVLRPESCCIMLICSQLQPTKRIKYYKETNIDL